MDKVSGQQMKKTLLSTRTKLANLENKIEKKFDLILDNYREYISDSHKQLLMVKSISDMNVDRKLAIIIQAEANYVEATGNQLDIFN